MKIPNSPSPNLPITKRVVLFVGFILATIHLVITFCANAFDESISHVLGPRQHHNIIIPCTQIISCMANLTFAIHLVITFCANTVFAKRAARGWLDCWHATSTADKRPGCSDSPQTLIDGDAVSFDRQRPHSIVSNNTGRMLALSKSQCQIAFRLGTPVASKKVKPTVGPWGEPVFRNLLGECGTPLRIVRRNFQP